MEYNGEQESSGVIERATVRSLCKKTQQNYIDRSAKSAALQAGIYFHVSVCEKLHFLADKIHIHHLVACLTTGPKLLPKASSPHSAI